MAWEVHDQYPCSQSRLQTLCWQKLPNPISCKCIPPFEGEIEEQKMSRNHGKSPKTDLKLSLLPRMPWRRGGPSTRAEADDGNAPNRLSSSSASSCVSSEGEQKPADDSPEAVSMVLAGCPRCLMYVMLPEADPKCPKCKSTVLLDFHHGGSTSSKSKKR